MLTAEQLEAIRGRWSTLPQWLVKWNWYVHRHDLEALIDGGYVVLLSGQQEAADLALAARTDIPALLSALEESQAEVAALQATLSVERSIVATEVRAALARWERGGQAIVLDLQAENARLREAAEPVAHNYCIENQRFTSVHSTDHAALRAALEAKP